MEFTYLIALIVFLPLIVGIIIFNQLIHLQNNRKQAFSDVDVQLKLRYDLIPNILEAVKGYATHEKSVLENITKARSEAMNAGTLTDKAVAENTLQSALKSLFAVAENYPDLKANKNFLHLQEELSDVEDKIAAARRFFNNATKEYNTAIALFPNNIIAFVFRFKVQDFFTLSNDKEANVVQITL